MKMEVYLYDVESDYEILSHKLTLDDSLTEFYELSDEKGSFFGIRINKKLAIQFAWAGVDKWLIDIPIEPGMHSLQKYATYDECLELINNTYKNKSIPKIKGLHKVPIREATIEEVIQGYNSDNIKGS